MSIGVDARRGKAMRPYGLTVILLVAVGLATGCIETGSVSATSVPGETDAAVPTSPATLASASPTPSPQPSPTSGPTEASSTPTSTPTPTVTPTPTHTATPTATPTPTPVVLLDAGPQPAADAPTGGRFRLLWSDPPTLDPHLTGDTTSSGVVVEVFSGLLTFDADLRIIPDIAQRVLITDGVEYIFQLRPGVTFHNGDPVTAGDFKWSMERAADPETASSVASTYLDDIVGFDDYVEGVTDDIAGIVAVDDLTLRITIDAPKAYFLAKMTFPTAYVLHRETVEAAGPNWWVDSPVGTGPFRLTEYTVGDRIVLERYDGYYRELAKVDTVFMDLSGAASLAMYENDEIDIISVSRIFLDRVLAPDDPLFEDLIIAPPDFSTSYIGFNTNIPPFDDVKFRQALSHVIDKETIASEVFLDQLKPAFGILPPGFPGYDPELKGLSFDVGLAQSLLAESKYADPDTRPDIVLTVPGTGGLIPTDVQIILETWRQALGVVVDIQQTGFDTFLEDLDRRKYQAFRAAWIADYPDPQDFLDILFHTDSGENHMGYSNLEVDRIVEAARVESDPANRMTLYNLAEKMIVEDAPWLPLWFSGDQYVLTKPYVEGYRITPIPVPVLQYVSVEREEG